MRILLCARQIPLGESVTKRSGEKRYILKDSIRIFTKDGKCQTIEATEGAVFLTCEGDANAIDGSTLLLWDIPQDMQQMIEQFLCEQLEQLD